MGSRVAEHDFGYLQSMLLKDENPLWVVCRLKLVIFPKNNPFSRDGNVLKPSGGKWME